MAATDAKSWPTLDEVEPAVQLLMTAFNAVDLLSIRVCGLIDERQPWEPVEGVPAPTLEDVGVLTYMTMALEGRVEGLETWLKGFRELRDSASHREAAARGGAS